MKPLLRLQARLELLFVTAVVAPVVTTACGVLIVDDAPPPDMARGADLAAPAPDLVALADFAVPDLSPLADLAQPPDTAVPPDLAPACVGVTPDKAAYGRMPGPWRFPLDGGGGLPDGGGNGPLPQPGDPTAAFQLTDFQPRSCGFGATYGLELFRGRPLVVSLWAGW